LCDLCDFVHREDLKRTAYPHGHISQISPHVLNNPN
jgi:hypothetical protein